MTRPRPEPEDVEAAIVAAFRQRTLLPLDDGPGCARIVGVHGLLPAEGPKPFRKVDGVRPAGGKRRRASQGAFGQAYSPLPAGLTTRIVTMAWTTPATTAVGSEAVRMS